MKLNKIAICFFVIFFAFMFSNAFATLDEQNLQQSDSNFKENSDKEELDFSLRKFISAIGDKELIDERGKYIREPSVGSNKLNKTNDFEEKITTATYNHSKKSIQVENGDIITYTIRIYNEGNIAGYVDEIKDYLPEGLEFILDDDLNASYGWQVSKNGRQVSTDITSKNAKNSANRDLIYKDRAEEDRTLLKPFDEERNTLDYIDVKIRCKVNVKEKAKKLINIAEITKKTDFNGRIKKDRDSSENNLILPADDKLAYYKKNEINDEDYVIGQEDDDDFEKVIVQKYDLALKTFITEIDGNEISERFPIFSMDNDGNMIYNKKNDPVEAVNGNIVVYTIRIYNEGNGSGYAEEIKNNIPEEGLEYIPDNNLNKEYRWKMYKEDGTETYNIEEAKILKTDYLSKVLETVNTRTNIVKAFNKNDMAQPDYKDVKIAFKVGKVNYDNSDITNVVEIAKCADESGEEAEDIDSTPNNNKEGEDDIDRETIRANYFDLDIQTIITEYTLSQEEETTVINLKNEFNNKKDTIVKVNLQKDKINSTILKYKYKIKITNKGDIDGYATQIKDYIPDGLEFIAENNQDWQVSEDGKVIETDVLKDVLLKPGESKEIEVTLKWNNSSDGIIENKIQISKTKNSYNNIEVSTEDQSYIDGAKIKIHIGIVEWWIYVIITVFVIVIAGTIVIIIKNTKKK